MTVPFAQRRTGSGTMDVEVEVGGKRVVAMLDTGFAGLLRLHAEALAALGLPIDMAAWKERGGLQTTGAGAGHQAAQELLVVLPEVRLGPIVYRDPIVQVSPVRGLGGGRLVAVVGLGALLPCARVGIDDERQVLELELGSSIAAGEDGRWHVPRAGLPLGLALKLPPAAARTEPAMLPVVVEVSPGSPADRAGLRAGDHIVAIDGVPCAAQPGRRSTARSGCRKANRSRSACWPPTACAQ